jgi:hypothetical protein
MQFVFYLPDALFSRSSKRIKSDENRHLMNWIKASPAVFQQPLDPTSPVLERWRCDRKLHRPYVKDIYTSSFFILSGVIVACDLIINNNDRKYSVQMVVFSHWHGICLLPEDKINQLPAMFQSVRPITTSSKYPVARAPRNRNRNTI